MRSNLTKYYSPKILLSFTFIQLGISLLIFKLKRITLMINFCFASNHFRNCSWPVVKYVKLEIFFIIQWLEILNQSRNFQITESSFQWRYWGRFHKKIHIQILICTLDNSHIHSVCSDYIHSFKVPQHWRKDPICQSQCLRFFKQTSVK